MFMLLANVAIALIAMLFTLELISGDKWLPRPWWLGIREDPFCVACTENPRWYIVPSETEKKAELAQHFQACLTSQGLEEELGFQRFATKLPKDVSNADPRKVRGAYCSERYWNGYGNWQRLGHVYDKAKWRLDTALEREDRAMLWNQIIGGVLHAVAWLWSFLVVVSIGTELSALMKPKDRNTPSKVTSAPSSNSESGKPTP